MADLFGKTLLITGGTRGIGREIALALANAGTDVAIVGRKPGNEAQSLIEEIRATGRRAFAYFGDLSDPKEAVAVVQHALDAKE